MEIRMLQIILFAMAAICLCSCAVSQQVVPVDYQVANSKPCGSLLPLLDTCVEQGVQNRSCEESELHVYSRVLAQTNDKNLARKAGTVCFLSCQSGKLQLGDVETEWRQKFDGCQ